MIHSIDSIMSVSTVQKCPWTALPVPGQEPAGDHPPADLGLHGAADAGHLQL